MSATMPQAAGLADHAFRKTAYRFVPLLLVGYVFNYLDRTCLGFAALTMNREIGLSASQFGTARASSLPATAWPNCRAT